MSDYEAPVWDDDGGCMDAKKVDEAIEKMKRQRGVRFESRCNGCREIVGGCDCDASTTTFEVLVESEVSQ